MAQRKRVGLITQRSQDRNLDSLTLSRLAQLVERKTINLVVVGSSPTVGARKLFIFIFARERPCRNAPVLQLQAPVAQLAARRSHNPKVASSILAGSSVYSFYFYFLKNKKNKK